MSRIPPLAIPLALTATACAGPTLSPPKPGSDRARLLEHLTAKHITHEEMSAGDGSLLVVPDWGARIEGAFFDDDNVLWVPQNLDPSDPGEAWNKGGARTWVAPEGHARGFFFDKSWTAWACPAAMDPGAYKPSRPTRGGTLAFANASCTLAALDGTPYALEVTREIGVCAAPRGEEARARGVKSIGIRFAHRLKNRSERTIEREIGLWSLLMIKPEAVLVVPMTTGAGGPPYRDYYEPAPADRISDNDGRAITMKVDGARRYKIGVSAARCRGLVGSIARLPGGAWQLIVKRFPWEAGGVYVDRPKGEPSGNGDPIQSYNHTGENGVRFYELECHGPAAVLKPGAEQEHAMEIWIYRGPEPAIREIGTALFGVDVDTLNLFQ